MSIPVLLGGSTVYLPPDLRKTASDTYKAQSFLNFVTKRIPDLVPGKTYAIQFRWVMQDGTRRQEWSPSYRITIPTDAPKVPTGFTGTSQFASVLVEWDGTYQGSNPTESFNNFKCINVYAGYQNTYSTNTAKLAGVLYADLIDNTVTLPVDGTYVRYGQPVYIFASASNLDGGESSKVLVATITEGATRASDVDLGPGAVTISKLKGDVLVFDNIKGGTISATSFLRAGNATGARIELSSSTTNITTYPDPITGNPTPLTYAITPGMAVYNTANQKVFSADLSGNISMTGEINANSGYIGTTDSGWQISTSAYGSNGTETSLSAPALQLYSSYDAPISGAHIKFNDQFIVASVTGDFYISDQTNSRYVINAINSATRIDIGSDDGYKVRVGAGTVVAAGTGSRFARNLLTVTTSNYNAGSSYSSSDGDVLLVYTP